MRYKIITKRTVVIIFLFCISVVLTIIGIAGRAVSAKQASATPEKLIPIYSVETSEKKIAITFDAAWGADDTDKIIGILKKYNAKATIFTVGEWARKYPDSVKSFYAAGCEIGNHSDSHKAYSKLSEDEIIADITLCSDSVEKAIGIRPTLLRAPSGDYTDDTITAAETLSMTTIQWSVDSLDWQGLTSDEIVSRVTAAAENGSIILFHNDVKSTPDALDRVLSELTQKGYSFVTVSDLIYKENYRIDYTGKQIPQS